MSNVDIHVIAERVAEVVNKKIAALDRRIAELESRLKKLELDVYTVRTQTIESIVRSILGVKVDDIASAIVARLGAELSATLGSLSSIVSELKESIGGFRETARELTALKDLPEKIAETVRSIRVVASVDTSKLESIINNAVSKPSKAIEELSSRVTAAEKRLGELSENINKVAESVVALSNIVQRIDELRSMIDEMKESLDYVREVSSILEERLKKVEEESEE